MTRHQSRGLNTDPLLAPLARVACDAFFETAEDPTRWASASAEQRATFTAAAECALHAARAGDRNEVSIARALCHGFWRDHPRPWAWERLGGLKQAVFLAVARRVIEAGKAVRAERSLEAMSREPRTRFAAGFALMLAGSVLLNPAVTPETLGETICRPGWAQTQRPPSAWVARVERAKLPAGADPAAWVMDHAVPIGLGGAPREAANLVPQTVEAAKVKDRLERRLHRDVCKGRLDLREAQDEIRRVWP